MARQAVIHIRPEKVPILAPAIRAVRITNLVKNFLQVVPLDNTRVAGRGKIMFESFGGTVSAHTGFTSPVVFLVERTYTHNLPMRTDMCLAALTGDVAKFECMIDQEFLNTLGGAGMTWVREEDERKSYALAIRLMEKRGYPVDRVMVKSADAFMGCSKFVPTTWPDPTSEIIIGSIPSEAGLMVTSPLMVDLWVEKKVIHLKLNKTLGFMVNPDLIVGCQVQTKEEGKWKLPEAS